PVRRVVRRGAVRGQRGQAVRGVAVPRVEGGEGRGEVRAGADHVDDVGGGAPGGDLRILQGFRHRGDEPGIRVRGEERGVHAVDLGQLDQYPRGDRPGVLLELVEVAGGEAE